MEYPKAMMKIKELMDMGIPESMLMNAGRKIKTSPRRLIQNGRTHRSYLIQQSLTNGG